MPRNQKDATFDFPMLLHDTVAAAAAGAALVGGVARIIDLGAGRMNGRVVFDLRTITVGIGDLATVVVQFSNTAAMNAGLFNGGAVMWGDVTVNAQSLDTAVPMRQELGVTNEISGATYRYMRLFIIYAAAGAAAFNAYLVKEA